MEPGRRSPESHPASLAASTSQPPPPPRSVKSAPQAKAVHLARGGSEPIALLQRGPDSRSQAASLPLEESREPGRSRTHGKWLVSVCSQCRSGPGVGTAWRPSGEGKKPGPAPSLGCSPLQPRLKAPFRLGGAPRSLGRLCGPWAWICVGLWLCLRSRCGFLSTSGSRHGLAVPPPPGPWPGVPSSGRTGSCHGPWTGPDLG